MADIHKFTKDGKTIWPATATEAIIDPETKVILSDTLESWNIPVLWPTEKVTSIETAIPVLSSKLPAAKQIPGTKVEFKNELGQVEEWEYVGGSTASFTDVAAWTQVGGVTLNDLILNALPVVTTLTVSSEVIPVGSATQLTFTWKSEQGGKDITSQCSYSFAGSNVTGNSKEETITPSKYEIFTRTLKVTYHGKSTQTEVRFTAVQPSYYGAMDLTAEIKAANIQSLPGNFLNPVKEAEISPINFTNKVYAYAYPNQLGALDSIKDVNGFEYLWEEGGFKHTTVQISGIVYNVYYLDNPATVKDYKFIFS